jgi:hypothetical protein
MDHEAIRKLALVEDAEALGALAEAATARDEFLRRTAVEAISRHPQGRDLRSVILTALSDPSEYVVRTACGVVAQWELHEAHELVTALLANPSVATRQTAVRALGSIWIDADFVPIFRIYTGAREVEIQREAAWVLRRRANASQWRQLFDAFHVDELARHRQWACELAARFSGSDVLPALKALSLDVDGHVRKAAVEAIEAV